MIRFLPLMSLFCLSFLGGSRLRAGEETVSPPVYKSPFLIEKLEFQEINEWYYLYLRQCFREAEEKKADVVILEIDSPGGRVDTALKIVKRLLDMSADLYVYVNENAISAGALISLTGKKIYINDGGIIGASTPVYVKEGEMKKAPEKSVSVIRSKFRSLAEKRGRPPKVCEAMVDEEIVLTRKEDGIDLPKGKLLTLTQKEALEVGVADKAVSSLQEVYADLNISPDQVQTYTITGSLKMLNLFANPLLLGLLLTLGTLGLILEARTPGWGVGGTLGILSLSAFFIIQILVGNADWRAPSLFAIGIVLLIFEVFIIPGFGLPGIAGIACILGSIFLSFGVGNWQQAMMAMALASLGVLVGSGFFIKYIPATRFFRRATLEAAVESTVVPQSTSLVTGDRGEVITDLRPLGKALFGGKIYEVTAQVGFMEQGTVIEITQVEKNKILVRKIPS